MLKRRRDLCGLAGRRYYSPAGAESFWPSAFEVRASDSALLWVLILARKVKSSSCMLCRSLMLESRGSISDGCTSIRLATCPADLAALRGVDVQPPLGADAEAITRTDRIPGLELHGGMQHVRVIAQRSF